MDGVEGSVCGLGEGSVRVAVRLWLVDEKFGRLRSFLDGNDHGGVRKLLDDFSFANCPG